MAVVTNTGNRAGAAAKAAKPAAKPTVTYSATAAAKGHPSAAAAHNAIRNAIAPKAAKPPAAPKAQPLTTPNALQIALGRIMAVDPYQAAQGQAQQAINTGLTPLKTAANQITGSENTATGRFKAYSQTAGRDVQNLIGQDTAGAASYANGLAQNAKATQDLINSTGTSAGSLAGGYLGPASQAALNTQRAFAGGMAGASNQYALDRANAGTTYLTSLAGALRASGQEGLANIQGDYANQLATNRASQNALIAAETAKIPDIANTIRQQQFADAANAYNLGVKRLEAGTAQSKATYDYRVAMANALTNRMNANNKAAYNSAFLNFKVNTQNDTNALNDAKLGLARYVASQDATYKAAQTQLGKINAQLRAKGLSETKRHDLKDEALRQQQILKSSGGSTSAANQKGIAAVLWAASAFNTNTKYGAAGKSPLTADQAHVSLTSNKSLPGATGEAGYQLGRFGYINQATAAALRQQGITVPNAWVSAQPPASAYVNNNPNNPLSLPSLGIPTG